MRMIGPAGASSRDGAESLPGSRLSRGADRDYLPDRRPDGTARRPHRGLGMAPNLPGAGDGLAEALLAAIVAGSDDAIVSKDLDGVVTSWNPAAERLFGYAAGEIVGRHVSLLAAPGREDEMPAILGRVRRGERVERFETVRRRKDGSLVEVSLTVSPVRDREGRVVGASKIARDVTGRERAAAEARRQARLLELSREAILAWELGGPIVYWNAGAEALYGYPREEALGRVSHELLRTVHPTDAAAFELALAEAGHWVGELVHATRDGRKVLVESRQEVLREPDGRLLVLETNRDVTARKHVEERLRSILETVPEAIVTIDERGLVTSFSPAAEATVRLPGGGGDRPQRQPADARALPLRPRRLHGPLPRAPASGGSSASAARSRACGKDGTVFPMELAVGEAFASGERFFTGFVRDLTQRQRLEQELRQAQKMEAVGQLTGGVAHDFNNLLTVVMGNLEMLEDRLADPDDLAMLREAREAAQLGAELTGRLLAFGRRQPLRPKAVDLGPGGPGGGGPAAPDPGRDGRGRDRAGPGPAAGDGRPGPAPERAAEPRHQRPRRDAGRRPADHRDRRRRPRRGRRRDPPGPEARPLPHAGGRRHRHRHAARGAGTGVRAVLHHQGAGGGLRAGVGHGLRLRQAERRPRRPLQRGRPRHGGQAVPAAG